MEAHGSFSTQHCTKCKASYPDDLMKQSIEKAEPPQCVSDECDGLVKPDVVFFGEGLPEVFHLNRTLPAAADLCIVLGTSLCVQPFASLPSFCKEGVPRVLINMERVGGLGSRPDDVLCLGDCDEGVRKFAEALGWLDELEALWAETELEPSPTEQQKDEAPPKTEDEQLQERLDRLTEEVDQTLKISNTHLERTEQHLDSKDQQEVRSNNSTQKDAEEEARSDDSTQADKQQDGVDEKEAPAFLEYSIEALQGKTKPKTTGDKKPSQL